MKKGEITAFLSLVFLLVMSFVGAMIESASIQVLKNHKRADMSLAMESIFAEYQKDMLEQYDIFALDGSYESGIFDVENLIRRLGYYGGDGMGNNVENFVLLTDECGKPFYEQAVRYMENKLGLDYVKKEEKKFEKWETEEPNISGELESALNETGESLPEEENPIQSMTDLKESGLLQIIVPDSEQLSMKTLEKENLASFRSLQKGNGNRASDDSPTLFNAYLMEHFSDITDKEETKALSYELEYLLGGKMSDRENLELVVKKILTVRSGVNYAYLLTDETKKAEAEVMALTLCSLLTVPGITELVKHALLLAWAYGEGIVELRALVQGKKVPFIKNAENWQLQLAGVLTLENQETWQESTDCENGMDYQDYLRGLLFLEKREELSMRALDLIECNIHIQADDCVTKLEVKSDCNLRRGIHYRFSTYFGYQ